MKTIILNRLLRIVLLFVSLGAFTNAQAQFSCACDVDISAPASSVAVGGSTNISNIGSTSDVSWTWYRDGNKVQTCSCPTYNATKPGDYQLFSNNCTEASLKLELTTVLPLIPMPSTSAALNTIAAGTYSNTTYHLSSDVNFATITGGNSITFTNCTFVFDNDIKMTVPVTGASGALDMTFEGCGFYGLGGTEWKGVEIAASGGNAVSFSECHFREATHAIFMINSRVVNIESCEFGKNGNHIAIKDCANSGVTISNNQFGDIWRSVDASDGGFPFTVADPYYQIFLDESGAFDIANNYFAETKVELVGEDVYGIFMDNCDNLDILTNYFDGRITHGIHYDVDNGVNSVTAYYNVYNTETRYIQDMSACDLHGLRVLTGIYSFDSDNLDIEYNQFYDCSQGVEIYSYVNTNSAYLYKNLFDGNAYGLVLATDNYPIGYPASSNNNSSVVQDVTFYCNWFYNSDLCGVIGWGTVVDQGASGSNPGDDASNKFSGNAEWNLLIDDGGGTAMTYHTNRSAGSPIYSVSNGTGSTPLNMEGGTASDDVQSGSSSESGACIGTLKKGMTTSTNDISITESLYTVYPNPFSNNLSIDLSTGKSAVYHIFITDMSGKTIGAYTSQSTDDYIINTTGLAAGMYLIQVYDDNNRLLHRQKLVKTP